MKKKQVLPLRLSPTQTQEAFRRLAVAWPHAHCELVHNTPFQLLLAVVLSAHTTDKSINKALTPLFAENPTFGPDDILSMGEENFRLAIKSIGLAPTKAKNCVLLSKAMIEIFDRKVPSTHEELQTLAGVGRKTANVVLNVVFGQPTMAVDTHVFRVAQRIGLVEKTSNLLTVEKELLKILPPDAPSNVHHQLIFHGRYHCTARSPKCSTCPLDDLCLKVGMIEEEEA